MNAEPSLFRSVTATLSVWGVVAAALILCNKSAHAQDHAEQFILDRIEPGCYIRIDEGRPDCDRRRGRFCFDRDQDSFVMICNGQRYVSYLQKRASFFSLSLKKLHFHQSIGMLNQEVYMLSCPYFNSNTRFIATERRFPIPIHTVASRLRAEVTTDAQDWQHPKTMPFFKVISAAKPGQPAVLQSKQSDQPLAFYSFSSDPAERWRQPVSIDGPGYFVEAFAQTVNEPGFDGCQLSSIQIIED